MPARLSEQAEICGQEADVDARLASIGQAAVTLSRELAVPLRELENGIRFFEGSRNPEISGEQQVALMRAALQKAEALIFELRELAGSVWAKRSPVRLETVIEKVYGTLRWEGRLGTAEFVAEFDPEAGTVNIDAGQIERGLHVFLSSLLQSVEPERVQITIGEGSARSVGSTLAMPGELRCVECEIRVVGGNLLSAEKEEAAGLSFAMLRNAVRASGGLFEWSARKEKSALRITFPLSECLED